MKAASVVIGLGVIAAIGGVAYAASGNSVRLEKGGVYTWSDKRGYPAADTKAQYESLGFASVSIIEVVGGWMLQGIWTYADTTWNVPEGLSKPQLEGRV